MSAKHFPLVLAGEAVGDLITVGNRLSLFTVRPDLAVLDGLSFRSVEEARRVAAGLLRGANEATADQTAATDAPVEVAWPKAFVPVRKAH